MKSGIEKTLIVGLFIYCSVFLIATQTNADTIYINANNINDTLLSEITPDSNIVIDNSITIDTALIIGNRLGGYFTVTSLGKPSGLEMLKYDLPLTEVMQFPNTNFKITAECRYSYSYQTQEIVSERILKELIILEEQR